MISNELKISQIATENPEIINLIRIIGNKFSKINPEFISKKLGTRTTIEQAAEIEKLNPNDLINYLNVSLGKIDSLKENDLKQNIKKEETQKPEFLNNLTENDFIYLDVREDILQGNDPILKIKDAVSKLNETNSIKLINFFEPIPLYFVLGKKGIKHYSENKGDFWEICFYK